MTNGMLEALKEFRECANEVSSYRKTAEELLGYAAAFERMADIASAFEAQLCSGSVEEEEPEAKPQAPAEGPQPKLEEVRAVLAMKARAGHSDAVRELLKKYGSEKLSGVSPDNYRLLLKDAEAITDAA